MINLDDIKGHSAVSLLETYTGINPYIRKLRNEYSKNKKIGLTENQSKYIIDNHDREPQLINRIISITTYLGEELKKQDNLSFVPEKILIEFILAETEKTYHVYGKLKQNQPESKMYWLPKTQVVDDIYFEEIKVEVDFSKYNDILAKDGKKLYKHQEEGIKFLLSRPRCILGDQMGLGKMESVENKLFTPYGRVRIGDIKIGDKVIGSDGLSHNVTGVFPKGLKDLYRVSFNDGYSILVGGEHLWSVSSRNGGENTNNRDKRSVILSTEQMIDKNLKLKQKGAGHNKEKIYEFSSYYKENNGNLKWQIPIVKPIEFFNNDLLPIEPYFLGLALGDGHFNGKKIFFTIHKDDFNEIFNGVVIKNYDDDDKRPNIKKCSVNVGDIPKELKLYNSRSHTKFIPNIYKYSSIENRINLLKGLMDTDGHCLMKQNKDKTIFYGTEYTTVSKQLSNDVAEIVHSLGGIVRKSSYRGSYLKNGITHMCKMVYKLNIKMPENINPFRITRKANLYNTPKKYKVGRYIKNIQLECEGEAVCISVDAPDKLYVTEHAIVTHNTTQSIIAALESNSKKILVVCPASLKLNWKKEIEFFTNNVSVVDSKKWNSGKFTIINYDILKNFHTITNKSMEESELYRDLVNENFDLIIADEAHYLKSPDAIRSKIINEISLKFNPDIKVWLLTGSPISNKVMDFYNLLKVIKAPIADNWKYFAVRYCDAKKFFRTLKNGQKKQIWLATGASNLEELSNKTKNNILRRLSVDVLDLPDKIVTPIYQELSKSGWVKYNELWDNYLIKREEEGKSININKDLVELGLLRKFIAMEAIPYTIELAENAIEEGKKVIIFTCFTEELLELQKHFSKTCVIHHGPMSTKDKQKSVDKFQTNDKIKVFIGNIISAGVGITLTESEVTIFNSYQWSPSDNEQAEFRNYRIGQKNNVRIYYQLFEDTISIRVWEMLRDKKRNISTILNENDIITEIIKNETNG